MSNLNNALSARESGVMVPSPVANLHPNIADNEISCPLKQKFSLKFNFNYLMFGVQSGNSQLHAVTVTLRLSRTKSFRLAVRGCN